MAILNMVVYILEKNGDNVDTTTSIVIVSVVGTILSVPVIGFFIFHLILALKGNTTREMLKDYDHESKQNQWCDVD